MKHIKNYLSATVCYLKHLENKYTSRSPVCRHSSHVQEPVWVQVSPLTFPDVVALSPAAPSFMGHLGYVAVNKIQLWKLSMR